MEITIFVILALSGINFLYSGSLFQLSIKTINAGFAQRNADMRNNRYH